MRKAIFLSLAAVAVLFASLAINVNRSNATSSVNLAELMQTASASEYWAFTNCADPFGQQGWSSFDNKWLNISSYPVPFSTTGNVAVCYAGGTSACNRTAVNDGVIVGTDSEGDNITISPGSRTWIGGAQWALERIPGAWDESQMDIVHTIGNAKLVDDGSLFY